MNLSHEALLELSTDGPISSAAREVARRLDEMAAQDVSRGPAVFLPPKVKPRDLVGDMARAIVAAVQARQTVELHDFRRAGIDDSVARELFPIALKRARRLDRAVDAAMEFAA
jgi:hypothetical protein